MKAPLSFRGNGGLYNLPEHNNRFHGMDWSYEELKWETFSFVYNDHKL